MPSLRAISMYSAKKAGAGQAGKEFSLTPEWFEERLERNKCEITGITFQFTSDGQRLNPFSPHIDRIDPSKGYTESNSQMVCAIYNMAKLDWTHSDVMKMAEALLARHKRSAKKMSVKELVGMYGVTSIAKDYAVSRPTVYDWVKRGTIPGKYGKITEEIAFRHDIDKATLCPEA